MYTYDEPIQAQKLNAFKSARGLSIASIILLSIHAALSVILIAAWPTVSRIVTEEDYSPTGMWDALCALAVGATAILQWGVFIACAVCFLCWLYRSYANLPALGSESILFSPKSAVTGWFIPFVNLVQGYKSVAILYAESQRGSTTPSGYPVALTTPIVGLWWAAYLARGITSRIADKMVGRAYDGALGWLITAELLNIAAAVLCIVIIYRIEKRQRDQHFDLERRDAASQPPPVDRLR